MSQPIPLTSQPLIYWKLRFSIDEATADRREAPWYGPWSIAMEELFAGAETFCPPPFITITYPQYPICKDIDVCNHDDDDGDGDDADDEGHEEDEDEDEDEDSVMMSPPPRNAPSPEVYKGFRQDLPKTPPKLCPQRVIHRKRVERSTRIPDFVQLVLRIHVVPPNNTLSIPRSHIKRIILLVEIKRAVENCEEFFFSKVFSQTDQQATHAFASHPEINILGLIIALGDCWIYREYDRRNMQSSPTPSERKDATYEGSDKSHMTSPSTTVPDVQRHFGRKGFVRLQETASDAAFAAIRKRLRVVSSSSFT